MTGYFRRKIIKLLRYHGFRRFRYKDMARCFYFKEVYDRAQNVDGDVVECGVAYGGSLLILGALIKQEGKGRVLYGFDSFQGFPEPTAEDESFRKPQKGEYGDASMERIKKLFKRAGLPESILVKGFVEDTVENFKGKIAFLHVDTDLYNSYKVIFKELFDKVVSGGVVLFDEYNEPKFPGATKAVDEFLASTDYKLQRVKYMDKFKFFIVK